jgi:hypothetical protein
MIAVFQGDFESCVGYIRSQEKKDETLVHDIVQSNVSPTLFYVKELDGWDTYEGSY